MSGEILSAEQVQRALRRRPAALKERDIHVFDRSFRALADSHEVLRAERDAAREALEKVAALARVLVEDHWSGCKEEWEAAVKATPELDQLLFADDNGTVRDVDGIIAAVHGGRKETHE